MTVTATADIPVGPGGWRVATENTWMTTPPYGGPTGTISTGCRNRGQWPGWACPNDYQLPAAFTIQEGQTEATATLRLVSDSRAEDNEERMKLRGTATRGSRTLTTNTLDLHISDTNAGLSLSAPTFEAGPRRDRHLHGGAARRAAHAERDDHPDERRHRQGHGVVRVSPCALTFTPQNWKTPKRSQ